MTKAEKQVIADQMSSEDQTLKELESVFKKAKQDCESKIADLNARTGMQNLQSVVYQKKYQEAILGQINDTLDQLQSGQYKTVERFLTDCYDNGFAGNMWMLQAQGIPMTVPIDDRKVVRALSIDSKLSVKYYTADPVKGRLGENITLLKNRIRGNISRGIVAGKSWIEVAKDIASGMNNPFDRAKNDAMRIVRTEGHRVNQQGFLDAGDAAKKKGADIVKQWDSTLDGRTRFHHRLMDGQIQEWDDDFVCPTTGESIKAPGFWGSPSEDCNCRCQLLQRARWALDQDELDTLKKRAEFFGLDKADSFEEYKKKYLELPKNADTIKVPEPKEKITLDKSNFPSNFTATKSEEKNTQMLIDYINAQENADPEVVELLSKMSDVDFLSKGNGFKISHSKDHAVNYSYRLSTGEYVDVKVIIPKLETGDIGAFDTTIHEETHFIDLLLGGKDQRKGWFSDRDSDLVGAFKKAGTSMSDEVKTLFASFKKEYDAIDSKLRSELREKQKEIRSLFDFTASGKYDFGVYEKYKKAIKEADKWFDTEHDKQCRGIFGGGVGCLQDIYDAMSGGQFRDNGTVIYGHGSNYYSRDPANAVEESVANYAALAIGHPELVSMLERDKPEVVKSLRGCVTKMLKAAKGGS